LNHYLRSGGKILRWRRKREAEIDSSAEKLRLIHGGLHGGAKLSSIASACVCDGLVRFEKKNESLRRKN
jgi:hypothetical protein